MSDFIRIPVKGGSARVHKDVSPETVRMLNVMAELAYNNVNALDGLCKIHNTIMNDNKEKVESGPIRNAMPDTTSPDPSRCLTFGEKAVGITFNPGNNPAVEECKKTYAKIIDQLNDVRNDPATPQEGKHLASVAITEAQGAQMWAVKAITWRD